VILILLALLATAACDLPRDPGGTLERVRGGTMRVGFVPTHPWVIATDGEPGGIEPRLLRAFARELGARIEWVADWLTGVAAIVGVSGSLPGASRLAASIIRPGLRPLLLPTSPMTNRSCRVPPAETRAVRHSPKHWIGGALAAAVLAACDGPQSALAPNGPAATAISGLYWVLTGISAVVFLVVCGLLAYALFRHRDFDGERPPLPLNPQAQREKEKRLRNAARPQAEAQDGGEQTELTLSDDPPLPVALDTTESDRRSVRWVVLGGVAIPAVILTGTLIFTLYTLGALTERETPPDLTIEAIGWQWWWEIHYYDSEGRQLFETANEVHIPAGKRVRVRLRAGDVIHSFWVPQLAGKMDMIPGRINQFWIEADEPGVYRGQCAEYCAGPHALMAFLVIAEPEEEFRAWVARQSQGEVTLADPLAVAGRQVFLESGCAACHAVRDTPAVANLGPDLTHVASRRTLAAVTIPNTKGHLGGWISNPQEIKPGNKMPAVPMDSEAFIALLRYVQSLK
jgi:cytochrome c oxidase subunit 2